MSIADVDRERLRRLAGRQFGLFTRAQALDCGYSAFQIRRRIVDGEWQRVLGGTLTASGMRVTTPVRDYAAQLAVPGSVLAGPSAARVFGMPVPDNGQYLYVGRHGSSRVRGIRLLYESPLPRDVVCSTRVYRLRVVGWPWSTASACYPCPQQ